MNRTRWYENYKVTVPEGKVGRAEIERFEVSESQAKLANLQMSVHGHGNRAIPAGSYTGLKVDGVMVMSDTPAEIKDHIYFFHEAKGRVLLNGLGIGMCLQAMLRKPEVEHVTVVEIEADVLALVAGHYMAMFGSDRLTFVHADALEWTPPKGMIYDTCWHDIWPFILTDYLPQYATLHRKYARRSKWQGSWCFQTLKAMQRREKAEGYY